MSFKNQHPLYHVWQSMRRRCDNPNFRQFKRYGGRGISVCERWLAAGKGFRHFLADMGPRPSGYTLDRIDNDGHYTPENCRWASRRTQQRNRGVVRRITVDGESFLAVDLADRSGLKTDTILARAGQGLPLKELLDPARRVFTEGLALGGQASGAKKRAETHCKHGHEFSEQNTKITKQGWRVCRKCRATRAAEARLKQKKRT